MHAARAGGAVPTAAARLTTILLVLLLAACSTAAPRTATAPPTAGSAGPSPTNSPSSSPGALSPFPVSLTDDEGTAVTIPAEPQRIVSLTPAQTEILFAIGAGDRIVGKVEDVANFPPEAADVPIVGRFDGVDVEKIVDAEADLVFAGGSGGTPPEAIQRLRTLGVPVVVVYAPDVDGVLADIELTGAAVGRLSEANELAGEIRQGFDQVQATTAGRPRPRVFYETGDQPSIYGIADDSVYAQMIELAGGDPITTGSATNWEMSVERLVAEDPELIILGDSAYGVTAEAVADRPGWAEMTAVREGAIVPIDDIVVTRPGPRLVDGLRLLVQAIHPDVVLPGTSPGASPGTSPSLSPSPSVAPPAAAA